MKKSILVLAVVLTSSLMVRAQDATADKSHPCKEIKKACASAGYVKGGHKKGQAKGLYKDCMENILAGKPVEGVSVPADVVKACEAKKTARLQHKKQHDVQ